MVKGIKVDKTLQKTSILLGTIIMIFACVASFYLLFTAQAAQATDKVTILLTNAHEINKSAVNRVFDQTKELTASMVTLYRDIRVHDDKWIDCSVCHGSSQAIYLAMQASNQSHIALPDGVIAPVVKCDGCHSQKAELSFWHFSGDD